MSARDQVGSTLEFDRAVADHELAGHWIVQIGIDRRNEVGLGDGLGLVEGGEGRSVGHAQGYRARGFAINPGALDTCLGAEDGPADPVAKLNPLVRVPP